MSKLCNKKIILYCKKYNKDFIDSKYITDKLGRIILKTSLSTWEVERIKYLKNTSLVSSIESENKKIQYHYDKDNNIIKNTSHHKGYAMHIIEYKNNSIGIPIEIFIDKNKIDVEKINDNIFTYSIANKIYKVKYYSNTSSIEKLALYDDLILKYKSLYNNDIKNSLNVYSSFKETIKYDYDEYGFMNNKIIYVPSVKGMDLPCRQIEFKYYLYIKDI